MQSNRLLCRFESKEAHQIYPTQYKTRKRGSSRAKVEKGWIREVKNGYEVVNNPDNLCANKAGSNHRFYLQEKQNNLILRELPEP